MSIEIYIYLIVGLIISLIGISSYRDDLESNTHVDTGLGIFLFSMLWPLVAIVIPIIAFFMSINWLFKKAYSVKIL